MRFLETTDGRSYRLTQDCFHEDNLPAYGILSHTWIEEEEVILDDLVDDSKSTYRKLRKSLRLRPRSGKSGYDKLDFCARQSRRDGLRYFWVDTCCIDQNNPSEVLKSINSMFQWYRSAAKCYVYLSDVTASSNGKRSIPWQLAFANSRWFKRGWTLQELLAPPILEFYSSEGVCLGSRLELKQQIHDITDIPIKALSGESLDQFGVDERLSWAVDRQTKREEDEVYALLGIFNVTLPFVYEGYDKALRRLLDVIDASAPLVCEQAVQEKGLLRMILPFRRDVDFVTRESLDIVHQLCSGPAGRAALVGLGGVGKSQIAIECCYRISEASPATWVFWVHAETRERLREGYLAIARIADIDGRDDPKANVVQLVHTWLRNEANERWLLVLDSADDPDVFSHEFPASDPSSPVFPPDTLKGSVLVTSRSHEVVRRLIGAGSNVVEVGPMNDHDAFALLQKKFRSTMKKDEADELIKALDYMPLALTQAAAFINRTPRMSISRYLEEIGYDQLHLSSKYLVDTRRDENASNSIMTTWQISFDYIRKRSSSAARLLSLMSMFDRQGIPKTLLVGKYLQHEHGTSDFDHDMYMLTSLCLVKASANTDSFEMHGLVQHSMKSWLELHNEFEHWKEVYVALIDENYPVGEPENLSVCQTLLPHALAALKRLPIDADALELWASLSLNVGWHIGSTGDHKTAKKFVSDSFDVREILLGPDDPETLDSLNSLGLTLKGLGQFEEAKTILERALEAQERTLGTGSSAAITTKINLATVYNHQTQWIDAERLLMEALRQLEESGREKSHPLALDTLNLLATVYRVQDRWVDATKLNLQLLEARSVQLGPDAPLTLIAKCDLSFTYRRQGRLEEAESMQLQIIESCIAHEGTELDLLGYRAHLAQTYRAQRRFDEAEALERQILQRSKEKLGVDHFDTLQRMGHLACTLWTAGKFEQAQALDEETLELRRRTMGETHLFTIDTKADLSLTYWIRGLYDKAEVLQLEVLKAEEEKLGADHPMTLRAKVLLATTVRDQGRLSEAEQMNQEVLNKRSEVLGLEHPDTLCSMSYLAIVYRMQGRAKEAVDLMGKCCKLYDKILKPGSTDLYGLNERFERWRTELEQHSKDG